MKVRYTGMFDEVDVHPADGAFASVVQVKHGEDLELDDWPELGESLLQQRDSWEPVDQAAKDYVADLDLAAQVEGVDVTDALALDGLLLDTLRRYAEVNGIDLQGATKKADVVQRIVSHHSSTNDTEES